jgi:superfamily II DNA helicase RecQ
MWQRMIEKSETGQREALAALAGIERFCNSNRCRHLALVEHFGQSLDRDNCQACDICTGQVRAVADPLIVAQKILSCVVRLKQQFGADYTSLVLIGSQDERIIQKGHDKLSTFGLLSDTPKRTVRDWIEQLVGQNCVRKQGEYNQLEVTDLGWQVLGGKHTPRLLEPARETDRSTSLSAAAVVAFPLFAKGESIEAVAQKMKRAHSTVRGYLEQYIRQEGVTDPSPWVDQKTIARVCQAIDQVGAERLKPIFERLDAQVPYEDIRIVACCRANIEESAP